jgi:hypothetical protein
LHLFESCDVFLAGRIPDCGRILQDRSNHGPVRRCLDGGGYLVDSSYVNSTVREFKKKKAYSTGWFKDFICQTLTNQ